MDTRMAERIRSFKAELVQIRRDIHQHPETGFNEHRTAGIVAAFLRNFGIEVYCGLGKTGVVGTLQGKFPGDRVIGLRADMDALSIQEETNLAYASVNPGVMHACGHDGHTAMLLGAARYLATFRDFTGTVRFIFQPAEENYCGAQVMVDDGLFEKFSCDEIYGMHAMPDINAGEFAIRSGPYMASSDTWNVVFKGTGGHGATPEAGTDPTMPAAAFISALQSIIGRNVPPDQPAVVSVGHLNAGEFNAPNIIPATVLARGTARCFTEKIRDLLEERITRLAKDMAGAYNCEAKAEYQRRYPALSNSESHTDTAVRAAVQVAGNERVNPNDNLMTGSEDFACMLKKVPGAYISIGSGNRPYLHTPNHDFNDDIILPGVAYWVSLTMLALGQEHPASTHK